jgi:glycosyltransferase involved in cell wall biosynthesis
MDRNMIKVLNLLLDERVGGPQNRVLSVAEHLKKQGIETIIVLPKGNKSFAEIARNSGLKVYQIILYRLRHFKRLTNIIKNLVYPFLFFPTIFTIVRIIKKEGIDIVHNNGMLSLQAAFAARLAKIKLVWHLNDITTPRLAKLFFLPLVKQFSSRIAIAAKEVGKCYFKNNMNLKNDLFLLYAPVDINKFNPTNIDKDKIEVLRKEFNIDSENKIVGCIGNISPGKGYEYFIQSAARIKTRLSNIKFMIVGEILETQRHYYNKLLSLIEYHNLEQDILFTGRRNDIPEILLLIDVFVLSSVAEACPIGVLEAMAMERLIVGVNVGGVQEQIVDGKTGFIVPPRDSRAISDAVVNMLKNPDSTTIIGKMARKRAAKIFSLEKCVERHKNLYISVINQKN